jgi:hypothetical protein
MLKRQRIKKMIKIKCVTISQLDFAIDYWVMAMNQCD